MTAVRSEEPGAVRAHGARAASRSDAVRAGMTVIVPAYNEAASIAETIASLRLQSTPPDEIIVVDDCSTDGTGEIAAAEGVRVISPRSNTGSKAGAQNFALPLVETEFAMAIDADTTLAYDAMEKVTRVLDDPDVAAACGFVLPRHVRSIWERGRYFEYMFAFHFYKPIQDYFEKPLISSGCFSAYRTEILRSIGGWSTRTMAEDMDLTWTLYDKGHKVRFVRGAFCYPIEPHDFDFMSKQLRRWSHGFIQNIQVHWRRVLGIRYLRSVVAVGLWDAVMASLVFLVLLPVLAIVISPWFLAGYLIDAPAVLVPVVAGAVRRREVGRALACYPGFVVLRLVNSVFMLQAVWREVVRRRPLTTYEKGH